MFKDFSFIVDIDGTICPIKGKEEKYEDIVPYKNVVEKLKYYHNNGARIIYSHQEIWIPTTEILV